MENRNMRLQRPILLTENYHTIAKQCGYTQNFGNGFLDSNGNFYIGLTQSALVCDSSSTKSLQGEKTAILELVIDWEQGKMIGHRITEFHNLPFNPIEVYTLGDCFIFASYTKEWLDSENEDWYTPTPEIFHIVTKDGTILSKIYFQGNVECCVSISEEQFIVVSGRYMEREWDYDYEEEGDENCCDYFFHQLEYYSGSNI